MTISKKTRLLPAIHDTRIRIRLDDPESLSWGVYSVDLDAGSHDLVVDWGDGTIERILPETAFEHTYQKCGTYEVALSDDISALRCVSTQGALPYGSIYPQRIIAVRSTARKLAALSQACFYRCANLTQIELATATPMRFGSRTFYQCTGLLDSILLPSVNSPHQSSFAGCEGISELHFSKAYEETIKASTAWESSGGKFGAENATVYFDL